MNVEYIFIYNVNQTEWSFYGLTERKMVKKQIAIIIIERKWTNYALPIQTLILSCYLWQMTR